MEKNQPKTSYIIGKMLIIIVLFVGMITGVTVFYCTPPPKVEPPPSPTPPTPPPTVVFEKNAIGLPYAWLKSWQERTDEVEKGAYTAGSRNTADYGDRIPSGTVEVDGFLIGLYEVTVDDFAKFVDAGGYKEEWKEWWSEEGWAWKTENSIIEPLNWSKQYEHLDYPVTGVSYYEAEAFCKMLGGKLRLPTEFEWEKAARGNTNNQYPWGDVLEGNLQDYANIGTNGVSSVGQYSNGVSPYGVHDMIGNVSEWTSTIYGQAVPPGGSAPLDGFLRDEAGSNLIGVARVCKGPSYLRTEYGDTIDARFPAKPTVRSNKIGFRVAADSRENVNTLVDLYPNKPVE